MKNSESHALTRFCRWFAFEPLMYTHLDELFVPPTQYETMNHILQKYGVLLLFGKPHLGKTYTALHILYEYFKKGFTVDYKPSFYRKRVYWDTLVRPEDIHRSNTIIYYEDIFGSTEPENIHIFKSELKKLTEEIQNSSAMVIISSHLEVCNVIDPEEFPMVIHLNNDSYTVEKRKALIDKYLSVYTDKDIHINNLLYKELTTPHSIKVFCEKAAHTRNTALLKLAKKAKNVIQVFAEEIDNTTTAEKAFLYTCYIFLESRGNLKKAKKCYHNLIKHNIGSQKTVDELLKVFQSRVYPLLFKEEKFREKREVRIKSHPSYARAIEESFLKNAKLITKIFNVIAHSKDADMRKQVPEPVCHNFQRLPEECHNVLTVLAHDKDPEVRAAVAVSLGEHFNQLPEEYRALFLQLSRDDNAKVRWSTIESAVKYHWGEMGDTYKQLLTLVKDETAEVSTLLSGVVWYLLLDKILMSYPTNIKDCSFNWLVTSTGWSDQESPVLLVTILRSYQKNTKKFYYSWHTMKNLKLKKI